MLVTIQLLVAIDFHCKKKLWKSMDQQLFSYQLVNFENK